MIKVIFIILVLLLIIFLVGSFISAYIITHGRRQTMDESWQWEYDNVPGIRRFTRDMFTNYSIKGPKDEDIYVSLLPAKEASNRYVILAHGYTDTRYGMMKYVPHYYDLGFNCILFDERGHGMSKPEPCSYSLREPDFLIAVFEDSLKRYGEDIIIGLHGESLGSATVLTSLVNETIKEKAAFAVEDCGFVEIIPVIKGLMKPMHVPTFMVYPASIAATIMYGISFFKARPIKYVKGNKIPLLCIHGADDKVILSSNSERAYEATEGIKELHLIKGADHALSAVVAPEEYGKIISNFINKVIS